MKVDIEGLPELNELAKERLASGSIEVYIPCSADSDMSSGPAYLVMGLTTSMMDDILDATRFCRLKDRWVGIDLNYAPTRDQSDINADNGGDMRIDSWRLGVDGYALSWTGSDKYSSETCSSQPFPLAGLIEVLNAAAGSDAAPNGMQWFGNALVAGRDEFATLLETIREDSPEFNALAIEAQMNETIDSAAEDAAEPAAPAAARRRLQI